MKTVSAYQCDYCRKYGKNKTRIFKHEERCCYNPRTRSCGTCAHFDDWRCGRGVDFEQEEGKRTPRLRTKCQFYENIDLTMSALEEELEFYQTLLR